MGVDREQCLLNSCRAASKLCSMETTVYATGLKGEHCIASVGMVLQ